MKKLKVLSDLLPIPTFTGIIICFFLPFLAVKCGDNTIVSMSGIDLVRGIDVKEKLEDSEFGRKMKDPLGFGDKTSLWGDDEEDEGYEDEYTEDDLTTVEEQEDLVNIIPGKNDNAQTPEEPKSEKMWFLMVPLLLALIGLVISFMKFSSKQTVILVISILGLLSMVYFGISLKYAGGMSELKELQGGMDMIKITLELGYYLATLLFLVAPVLYSIRIYMERLQQEEASTFETVTPKPPTNQE
jgi:cation transport ATPase